MCCASFLQDFLVNWQSAFLRIIFEYTSHKKNIFLNAGRRIIIGRPKARHTTPSLGNFVLMIASFAMCNISARVGATLNFRRKWQSKKILQCANLFGLPAYFNNDAALRRTDRQVFISGRRKREDQKVALWGQQLLSTNSETETCLCNL